MIIYELACAQGHRFEGWFASADDFAAQSAKAMVRCPACDDQKVTIVPSARVRVGKAAAPVEVPAEQGQQKQAAAATDAVSEAVAGLPAELVQKLREAIRNTEDVGARFPDEARKIHYDEVPARPIRGQATSEEADALREEGIDFAQLPGFLTRESH
jgi:hypothetical protein